MGAPEKADWVAIEGLYRAGGRSLRSIADDYGISEAAIRHKARKRGWMRDPTGSKRELVKAALSGMTGEGTHDAVRNIQGEAAADVEDMEMGLRVARECLRRLEVMAGVSERPQEVKVIVEANKVAVETIRRIRGLDDATDQEAIVIERSYGAAPKPTT